MARSHQKAVAFFLARLALFAGLFVVTEIGFLVFLHQQAPAFFRQLNPNKAGSGTGNSLARFRDIEKIDEVDILFIGSSHTYRGFDPSIFARHGYSSYNVGSKSSRALNTYVMLKEYLPRLKPRLVVFETFLVVVAGDGMESYYDLLANRPISFPIVEMALRIKKMDAFKSLFMWSVKRLFKPFNLYRHIRKRGCTELGYCSSRKRSRASQRKPGAPTLGMLGYPRKGSESPVRLPAVMEMQLDYLARTIDYTKDHGSQIVFVIHPFPDKHKERIGDVGYERMRRIEQTAKERDVSYYDFNYIIRLDSKKHFRDRHHLNQAGVDLFNEKLITHLEENGHL
ncbi:MAG: hypothetical protein GY847_14895 [Proteobacteria bacterium]|nr:hypothetical protein [Pseudomonadota bacterium]